MVINLARIENECKHMALQSSCGLHYVVARAFSKTLDVDTQVLAHLLDLSLPYPLPLGRLSANC